MILGVILEFPTINKHNSTIYRAKQSFSFYKTILGDKKKKKSVTSEEVYLFQFLDSLNLSH